MGFDEIKQILEDIVEDDKRASDVIAQLRRLMIKGETKLELMDLNEAASATIALARGEFLARKTKLDFSPESFDLPVKGNFARLQQVILNLVMNAGEAMAGVAATERRLIVRTALVEGEGIRVSIADQGLGIAPEHLERVFEPFFTTKAQGLGLGLAFCRSIIIAHGGRLWATRNAGRGASFHFALAVSS